MRRADRNRHEAGPLQQTKNPYGTWLDGEINELEAGPDYDPGDEGKVVVAVNRMCTRKQWPVICRVKKPKKGRPFVQVWGVMDPARHGQIPEDVRDWFEAEGYRFNRGRRKKSAPTS